MQTGLYFASILLTGVLAGFLALYAWRQRSVPGSRAYAGLALDAGPETLASETQAKRSLAVFLLIFALMAVSVVATGYLSYQNYEQQFRRQVESQLSGIAELKVDELLDWRRERLADAEILHQNPAFSALVQRYLEDPADAQAQAELRAWLSPYQAYGQYDRIFLLDARGVERLSVLGAPEPVAAHLTQEVAAILSAGQVTFLDLHRDTADGPIHMALLVPISAGQESKRPLGALVLRIDPNLYLYPFIQQWPVPSASAETLLVRREGADALFLNELKFQADTALKLRVPLDNTHVLAVKAVLGQTGIVEGMDYRGVPAIADVRPVPGTPWFLVARVDAAEVYAPLRERLWQTVFFFGALMAASGAGLMLIWRQQRVRYYRGQVEAAQSLRESEDKFKYVFDHSLIGKSITLPSGEINVNQAFCDMLGYTQEELQTQSWQDISHPDDIEATQRIVDALLFGEQDSARFSKRYIHKNGSIVWADVSTSLRRDKEGKTLYFMTAVSDITERKRQEAQIMAAQAELQRLLAEADQARRALLSVVEDQKAAEEEILRLNAELEQRVTERTAQLEATNKEMEAFSYSVSHDLRAPLRGIDGWSLALLEDHSGQLDEQAHQYLGYVRSEVQRMGRLIDAMLQLSRVTRAEMQLEPVDLSALAQTIAARLQAGQPERQAELVIQPGLTARGDARLIEIMLANLFDNAWKFTAPRPLARIEFGRLPHPTPPPQAGEGREGVVYFVRDNGVGFDMAYAQKLFGAFQRMHKASEFPGTGIGLTTVQRIVYRHGGRVWADAHLDQGATFYFTLEEVT
ncbi:MAG: PAS domain S-box protein [Thermoflexales bacterium]|nr:PAS domain S-box protein [Thermoflexales bacterium]